MTADELEAAARALVDRSRREQQLPPRISDPAAVGRIASLIAERRDATARKAANAS